MKRFIRFLIVLIPFFAAETIQYCLYSMLSLTNHFVDMSDELIYMLSSLVIAFCGIIYYFWYRFEIRGEARGRLKSLLSVKYITLFLLLGIGSQFCISAVMTLLQHLFIKAFSNYSEVLQNLTSGNEIMVLLLTVLIAPVTEELIFRGVTLHLANRFFPFWIANILQAFLFGVYHGNVIQGIYAMLLGLLLGVAYFKFKMIFAPILLHMIINASAFLVGVIPGASTLAYITITISGGISVLAALLLMKPANPILPYEQRD